MFIERPRLRDIADKISLWLQTDGFECLDTDWDPASRTLRAYIDHPNGIGFDQCVAISERLVESEELDKLIPCDFNIEVSSPGIERPLRTKAHFLSAMNEGARVDVKLTEKYSNRRKGIGLITAIADDDLVDLRTEEGPWTFPLDLVQKALKLVDWTQVKQVEMPQ